VSKNLSDGIKKSFLPKIHYSCLLLSATHL